MDISIIILNYKSKGFVMNCIKSITEASFDLSDEVNGEAREGALGYEVNGEAREGALGHKKLSHEIIVVDNNSDDKIGEFLAWQYPEVIFIQNKVNVGMGAGNNVGIKRAQGDYIVVMNPDIISYKNTFKVLYNFMEEEKQVGVCGPKQLNPDGSIQNSCYRWPRLLTPIYRRTPLGNFRFAQKDLNRYLMKDFDHNYRRPVNWLLGSFLFIRASAMDEVGMFDERYFMYLEDTDYCRRFWEKDWKVIYYPKTKIIHNHNRHSAQYKWYKFFTNMATRQHIISWFKYLKKWRGK